MIPTSTELSVQISSSIPQTADGVAVFVGEKQPLEQDVAGLLSPAEREAVERLIASGAVRGKLREVVGDAVESRPGRLRRVLVIGLGSADKLTGDLLRECAAAVLRTARRLRLKNVSVLVPGGLVFGMEDAAEAIVSGLMLAAFRYVEYQGSVGQKKEKENGPGRMSVALVCGEPRRIRASVDRARTIAEAQNFARTIAQRPGNVAHPPAIARVAQELAKEVGLRITVLDEKQAARLGMGGLTAVGAASANPPRLIALEYKPARAARAARGARGAKATGPLLVVGKTLTFDAGGISIKTAQGMDQMVYDKCGGMAVLGLMYAVARIKPDVPVVGLLSVAENVLGSRGYRPGDILSMYNGVTVEVTNTDAEGRLVLGDALAWGIETYQPAAVVDLATLTGGVIVALGKTIAGMMGNDEQLAAEIQKAADRAGEKLWRLPVGDEQRELMKSDRADIVNSGPREASPLQGGAFLSYFIPDAPAVPWVHLDIAGTATAEKEMPYYGKGATGWGVRTLVEWVADRANRF